MSSAPAAVEMLAQLQDELGRLQEQLDESPEQLLEALQAAEDEMRDKTEQLLRSIESRMRTVPHPREQLATRPDNFEMDFAEFADDVSEVAAGRRQQPTDQLSPGQQWQQLQAFKALADPRNPFNRRLMQDRYGVQLPSIQPQPQAPEKERSTVVKGSNVEKLTPLPKANRVDAGHPPPTVTLEEARRGIRSLIERGVIPPAYRLTLNPSPIRHRTALVHEAADKIRDKKMRAQAEAEAEAAAVVAFKSGTSPKVSSARSRRQTGVSGGRLTRSRSSVPPPTTPTSRGSSRAATRFVVQNGAVRAEAADFKNFQQRYCLDWGCVMWAVRVFERFAQKFTIPIAFVNGEKFAELAVRHELDGSPTDAELLECVNNRDDVEDLVLQPGRRFRAEGGQEVAAALIQAAWRGHKRREEYREYKRKKWAAGIIAIEWILHLRLLSIKKQLKETRARQLENYRRRFRQLEADWDSWRHKRRVVVHLPSLGYPQHIRDRIRGLGKLQNVQMARLFDLRDPKVDVVLVSPVPVSDEVMQYYAQITGLKAAVDSGDLAKQSDISERYRIVVPEAVRNFPHHNMCLATLLKYSPRALRRIREMVAGRRAFIVPGFPCDDDLAVADKLNLPILCAEPEVTQLYGTKSGAKRIFKAADVPTPPSDFDICSLPQLHDCLAQLVTENLRVRRWLLKIDSEFAGRGIGFFDAFRLDCYEWALKECERFGDKWHEKWAHEKVYLRVLEEMPQALEKFGRPARTDAYASWEEFLDEFVAQGGIVEATPPSELVASLTADLCIEPTGNFRIVSCGDQISSIDQPYRSLGASVPQCSVLPAELNALCERIGAACWDRRIFGHVSIDFVAFEDPKTQRQTIWATDVSLHYSDNAAMTQLLLFATNGRFDPLEHELTVAMSPAELAAQAKKERKTGLAIRVKGRQRFATMSAHLWHTNLAAVHFSVFFQTCKAQGIGFDVTDKTGTMFTLVDSFHRDCVCMMTVSDDLCSSLRQFLSNLTVIDREISTPDMRGNSNFFGLMQNVEDAIEVNKEKRDSAREKRDE